MFEVVSARENCGQFRPIPQIQICSMQMADMGLVGLLSQKSILFLMDLTTCRTKGKEHSHSHTCQRSQRWSDSCICPTDSYILLIFFIFSCFSTTQRAFRHVWLSPPQPHCKWHAEQGWRHHVGACTSVLLLFHATMAVGVWLWKNREQCGSGEKAGVKPDHWMDRPCFLLPPQPPLLNLQIVPWHAGEKQGPQQDDEWEGAEADVYPKMQVSTVGPDCKMTTSVFLALPTPTLTMALLML